MNFDYLKKSDPQLYSYMLQELHRQKHNIELIASENIVTEAVMEAMGSFLTNKYAEGYPGKRYYGGCEYIDEIEELAIYRMCKLFDAKFANVQPHSGSQANFAVYFALLEVGDKILGMDLSQGGHLTHGSPVNVSGKYWEFASYGVAKEDLTLDYDAFEAKAKEFKPKMIVAGASAYPREIDFARMSKIAKEVGAIFFVDMAHIAGEVAAGFHNNPVPVADVVTTTTHKTLRGPRGGAILTNDPEIAKKIDKAVFPGIQGGPLEHVIASKATCFLEASRPEFKEYMAQVIKNSKRLAEGFLAKDYVLVGGGTDNHMILVDLRNKGVNGRDAQNLLDSAHITLNKNSVPFDTESFFKTSGVRIGTPAVTTRGMVEEDMDRIVEAVDLVLVQKDIGAAKEIVAELVAKYPLYPEMDV